MSLNLNTQNGLLLQNLLKFYKKNNNMDRILPIINGEAKISLRLIDWFATNYSKKNYTVYILKDCAGKGKRFKVYIDYKLKLKAYSKRRFDPFCRWDRITVPYKDEIIDYIEMYFITIQNDMNKRNSTSKNRKDKTTVKTRKRREELSISASKSIKKEKVEIIVDFK